jgi:hypothetical protein
MATLILNTVGTMLGGPIGGAIGAFVGQSIDQQLFGPGPRRGPRLGDLSVQSSTYDSPIPRVFGTMRVAGSIIWATDLQEHSNTEASKGQPDSISYSYSASFAVALSSRPVTDIGRIWADGKLIRDADGQFAVATEFRLLSGSEDQDVDPLIASIEGIGSTPAYRGVALAIFENFQLVEFGNRIPFLTFEVIADADAVPAAVVLTEVSEGAIVGDFPGSMIGYAAYGGTMKAAVQPLVDLWDLPLFDDGFSLSTVSSEPLALAEEELGCTAESRPSPRIERTQVPAASLPSSATLSYYDPARDYQTGVARASLDGVARETEAIELPAVLDASAAKALVETSLARSWAERDGLKLRLPPKYLQTHPGALLALPGVSGAWRAHKITIDGLAAVAELRPTYQLAAAVLADPGRVAPSNPAIPAPTELAIVELPDDGTGSLAAPAIFVAATSSAKSWRAVPLQVELGGSESTISSANAPTIMGQALTQLRDGQSAVFDLLNSVDVELTNEDGWLEGREDDALAAGANLALLGSELIQFGSALALGGARFRLGRLLRGRRGSEWAMALHSEGEPFVMLDPLRLRRLDVPAAQKGALIRVTPAGLADSAAQAEEVVIAGEAMRPPSPVRLSATRDAAGNLLCEWVRRSSQGWSWLDSVETPLGCSIELYRVTLTGPAAAIQLETGKPQLDVTTDQLVRLGTGEIKIAVEQVGDLAVSRPALSSITTF